jgi:hypothetical protein
MKTHKAYKIDSSLNRIDTVLIEDYKDIQDQIGCRCFAIATILENGDTLFVDDEGYLNSEVVHGFFYGGQFFAGNGLLLGGDDETGESVDVKTSELDVAGSTNFPPLDFEINDAMRDEAMSSWSVTAW